MRWVNATINAIIIYSKWIHDRNLQYNLVFQNVFLLFDANLNIRYYIDEILNKLRIKNLVLMKISGVL